MGLFNKKPKLPRSVEVGIAAKGVIDLDNDTGLFVGRVNFRLNYWLSEKPDEVYEPNWSLVEYPYQLLFVPPGRKNNWRFEISSSVASVLGVFKEPWEFTMDVESIEAATTMFTWLFQNRVDEYMTVLTGSETHREIAFEGLIGTGTLDLKPLRETYGW